VIEINTDDLDELRDMVKGIPVAEKALLKAILSAINSTMTKTRTKAIQLVRRDYAAKAQYLRVTLPISRATTHTMEARMLGEARSIPLAHFDLWEKGVPSTIRFGTQYSPKMGVSLRVMKGSYKKIRTAFVAKMSSGHVGVFSRFDKSGSTMGTAKSGKERIQERFGPSPGAILASTRYDEELDDFVYDTLETVMAEKAEQFIGKMGLR